MRPPNGWTKTLLHHVADVRTGLSKSKNRKGPTVRKPYLRVANVQDGYIDLFEVNYKKNRMNRKWVALHQERFWSSPLPTTQAGWYRRPLRRGRWGRWRTGSHERKAPGFLPAHPWRRPSPGHHLRQIVLEYAVAGEIGIDQRCADAFPGV